jgi:hypothetical protein
MPEFDEEAAAREVERLAATDDMELAEAIWAAATALRLAWDTYRSGPAYPAKSSPTGAIADDRGTAVAQTTAAMAAVAPDDLAGAVRAASHVLGAYFPNTTPAEAGVADAVEALRYAAKRRPQMVRDARIIKRGWNAA